MTIVFLALYLVAMVLTFFLKMPEEQSGPGTPDPAAAPDKSSAPTPA